jgi:polyhydroxyalkanoate synthesis regulator protein
MKKNKTTFYRTAYGHYTLNGAEVGLTKIRAFIKAEKPFRVLSATSGKDITRVAIARAIAYRFIHEGRRAVATQFKKGAKLLSA